MSDTYIFRKEFAQYTVHEFNPAAFSVSYVLIKNGELWGTFYHVSKGAEILWTEKGGYKMGHYVFPSREKIEKVIMANEKRLAKKYS